MTLDELRESVLADLTTELREEDNFNEAILGAKVDHAIKEVRQARRYPSIYTDAMIASDLAQYESNVYEIALYEYNQVGMDSQTAHSENGVSRTFVSKSELYKGIIPLAVMS